MLEPRAEEIAEAILSEPHVVPLDRLGAVEIGRLEALIEALDRELARVGLAGRGQRVVWLLDTRLRASSKLVALLDRFAATPKGRSQWGRDLAESESLAESIRRRREGAQ